MPKKSNIDLASKGVLLMLYILTQRFVIRNKGLVDLFDGFLKNEDEDLQDSLKLLEETGYSKLTEKGYALTNKGMNRGAALSRFGDDPTFMSAQQLFLMLPRAGERLKTLYEQDPEVIYDNIEAIQHLIDCLDDLVQNIQEKPTPNDSQIN